MDGTVHGRDRGARQGLRRQGRGIGPGGGHRGMLAQVIRRRALDWFFPAGLGTISALVVAVGFYLAMTARFGERLVPPPAAAAQRGWGQGGYRVLALGDSMTEGTGDTPERGYVARLVEDLRARGRSVSVTNLAEGGDETADLLRKLDRPETVTLLGQAHLILISIGGNDLTHGLRGRLDDQKTAADGLDTAAALQAARTNLRQILLRLRAANPTAPVRLVGIYNPFEVLPGAEAEVRAQLADWNLALERATHEVKNALVVPVADLFHERPDRLAGDRFHPGPRGHRLIADRVFATLPDAE
jgi:lysophospholipase L1-like esterase